MSPRPLIISLLLFSLILPTSAELLVHYPFNDENGTIVANQGTQRNGTMVGGATYGGSKDTTFGQAFYGNRTGANDGYVQTGLAGTELGLGPGSVYTAMAWVNWSGPSGNVDHMVFGQEDGPGNASQLHHGIRADSTANIHYGGWGNDLNDAGTVPIEEWTHVAWSFDGTNKIVFVNGVETSRGAGSTMAGHALPVIVGGHGRDAADPAGQSFNGAIDEVKIFSEALTAAEIQVEMPPSVSGPSIPLFKTSPTFINSGDSSMLSWQVLPPFTSISIDNGIGNVLAQTDGSGSGSLSVSPNASTTYTITATNEDGETTQTSSLFVDVDPSTPRINEFSADTTTDGLTDEDGDNEDWIEIYNPGPNGADLSNFYLTDNPTSLNEWAFPAITMQPDSYLIVFASGKNRAATDSQLHTNFKLSSRGEYLALVRKGNGGGFEVIGDFSPEYPAQEEGLSYGLAADGITLGFLVIPTPNAINGPVGEGFVADTTFDIDRGFFTTPFNLTISTATPDAQIRYTTDGSEPTPSNGRIYTSPISINSTRTIRAAAFKAGFFATNVDTHTYFFLDDIRTQYASGAAPSGWPSGSVNGQTFNYGMDPDIVNRYSAQEMIDALSAIPSISISTDQSNLTGSGSQGIYVNPGSRGKGWERPASFEVIHPDDTATNLQSNCGIRVRGGFSRSTGNPKHAFRIFFRNEYGDGKLSYPMFGAEGVDKFDKLDLRTSQNYSWAFQNSTSNTFLREVLGRDLQSSFYRPYTRSRYYHLYLNGIYWGLYMTQERAEANHGEAYLGGDDQSYDTIKSAGSSGGYNTEATDGSFATGSDWNQLWNIARTQRSSPTITNFMMMQGLNPDGSRNPSLPIYLDVDNLIDYQMIIGYTGNYDAPLSDFVGASNNWYTVRDRERDSFGFQFFVHDGEHSMGAGGKWNGANDRINTSNGSGSRGTYNKSNPSFIHFDLAERTEEYRLRFADRAHLALFNNGQLTRDRVFNLMEARRSTVSDVIIAESARWGDSKRSDPLDEQDWINAVNSLIGVINNRSEDFLGHLRLADLYPDLPAPKYSQHGGDVTPGTSIGAIVPTSGTHFYYMIGTGDPERTSWQDPLDSRLVGGDVNPSASVLPITGGGPGGVVKTDYINNGDNWKYLDNGSNQGTAWRTSSFNDNSWAAGSAELGYGDGDEATVLNSGPSNAKFPTTYFRKAFAIPDPSVFGDFQLTITYDDAYVVYVNGIEAARHANLPSNPAFDLYSGNTVGNNAIDTISIPTSAFSAGQNTIAVEIHQGNSGSSDISFDLSLTGRPEGGGETIVLNLPDTINEPVWIKSRTYNAASGTWSAMNQAFFSIAKPAAPSDIVISEVHYHPNNPTTAELLIDPTFDQDDFEFIEILNIGPETVDLGDAAFVLIPIKNELQGVEFTFPPGTLINSEQRLIIAANTTAFATRYPGTPFAGDYSNRLSNTGEWITLVDKDGNIIDSFRYNDISPWPEAADGTGPSLIRNNPSSDLDPTLSTSWNSSPKIGGSPGTADGTPFLGDPLADLDGDGFVAIIEYAQGLSDTVFSSQEHLETSSIDIGGIIYPAVSFREDPDATDAIISLEVSPSLGTASWDGSGASLIFVSTENNPDGISRHTYRLNTPMDGSLKQFFRLKVSY